MNIGPTEPVPSSPEAQAAGPDVSEAVTSETQPAGTPEQAPAYMTEAGLASYLQANGYVPERVVQSRIDKAVAAARRQIAGTPDDQAKALAAKYGVPEANQAAFIEEAKRRGLLTQDAPDEGVEQQQAAQDPQAGDVQAQWGPVLYQAGLRQGDPELAKVANPYAYPNPAAYMQAVLEAGQLAQARRAQTQKAPPAPAAAAAVFPRGGTGGKKTVERPTTEDAQRAFFGG